MVYLTRVGAAFASFAELWRSAAIPVWTKRANSATHNPLGDLFEPRPDADDPLSHVGYQEPCKEHDHWPDGWHHDIASCAGPGNGSALLVGEVEQTYLWDRPHLFFPDSIGRGQRKGQLGDLFDQLAPRP